MNDRKRTIDNCNFIKTILMMSVILYHSMALWLPNGWFNQAPAEQVAFFSNFAVWLNSFHIYAFALVSGYIYAYSRFEKGKYVEVYPFVRTKAKRLLVPYIFVALLWAAPIHAYFFKVDISDLVDNYILGKSPAHLWFVLMLFWVFVLARMIEKHVYGQASVGFLASLFLYAVGEIGPRMVPNLFGFFNACKFFVFFWMGMMIWKYGTEKLERIPTVVYIGVDVFLAFCLLVIDALPGAIFAILAKGIALMLHSVGAIMAFVILNRLACWLNKKQIDYEGNSLYNFLYKHSFGIYLFHQQIIYFVINILNGRISPILLVAMCFIISLFVSSIICVLLETNKITRGVIASGS
ncbi:MAG: acyltransferase [Lachnospiraceae bacterium]|nr:acyltransferase [Lachnospiraceae bacterium]